MLTGDEMDVMRRAVRVWGRKSQYAMLVEEAAEAIAAAMHTGRTSRDPAQAREELIGELADLSLMLDQVIFMDDLAAAVRRRRGEKLAIVRRRIEEAEAETGLGPIKPVPPDKVAAYKAEQGQAAAVAVGRCITFAAGEIELWDGACLSSAWKPDVLEKEPACFCSRALRWLVFGTR